MTNTNVMTRAWEIAKKGQKNFGGKVGEYLSAALKMAWMLVKNGAKKFTASIEVGKRGHWIAKVTGTHPQYKLDREFLTHDAVDGNWLDFYLTDGLYTAKYSNASAHFFIVEDGDTRGVSYSEAIEIARAM